MVLRRGLHKPEPSEEEDSDQGSTAPDSHATMQTNESVTVQMVDITAVRQDQGTPDRYPIQSPTSRVPASEPNRTQQRLGLQASELRTRLSILLSRKKTFVGVLEERCRMARGAVVS